MNRIGWENHIEIKDEIIAHTNKDLFPDYTKNHFYIKLSNELKELKSLLNNKIILLIESDIIFDSTNIYKTLYNKNILNTNSIEASSTLYYKYILFIVDKIQYQIKYWKNITNTIIDISLLDSKIIFDFYNNSKYKETTKANRYNNLIRILKIIFPNNTKIFPTKLFVEKKHTKFIIINSLERINILNVICNLKDINILLLWYLLFYLGLSVKESSNLILENILIKKKLYLIRNEKIDLRNINDNICSIINKLIISNDLNQKSHLLFFNIGEGKIINRINFIKSKFDIWIKNINFLSQEKKDIIIKLFLTERESIRMTKSEKK